MFPPCADLPHRYPAPAPLVCKRLIHTAQDFVAAADGRGAESGRSRLRVHSIRETRKSKEAEDGELCFLEVEGHRRERQPDRAEGTMTKLKRMYGMEEKYA